MLKLVWDGDEYVLENGKWSGPDPDLVEILRLLSEVDEHPTSPTPSDPDPEQTAALRVVGSLPVFRITEHTPPAPPEERID
jgi:hypothetical protein